MSQRESSNPGLAGSPVTERRFLRSGLTFQSLYDIVTSESSAWATRSTVVCAARSDGMRAKRKRVLRIMDILQGRVVSANVRFRGRLCNRTGASLSAVPRGAGAPRRRGDDPG